MRSFSRLAAGAILVLPLLCLSGCRAGHQGLVADHAQHPWNVLLVTFDTTRADRLGCYGNKRIKTPALDGLAAHGVRFARALTAVPITEPSHSTIMTGRYPIAHGVRDNGLFVLGKEQTTLAEMLHKAGYATGAAIGAYPLVKRFGLNQGFDYYNDHLTGGYENYLGLRDVPKDRLFFDERKAAQVNEALLPWIDKHADKPFFAWAHYFDPHQPFEPPPPYNELYADDLYDGEIAYADSRLGFLLDHLKKLGVLDRTLVVISGDHGEGRGDHNELTHAVLAYDSTLHVPLIMRPPAGVAPPGTVVHDIVGTVDIVPTILDILGINAPPGIQGHSLRPLWQPGSAKGKLPRIRYAENLSPHLTHGWGELRVLIDGSMKYIHGPRSELYDLDTDPHELHNLIKERPQVAARMRKELVEFLHKFSVAGVTKVEDPDDEVRKKLEALGYLQSTGPVEEKVTETLKEGGIAPQDRVGDLNDISAAKHLLFAGSFAEALQYSQRLMKHDPDSPMYEALYAAALGAVGRLDEAWKVESRLIAEGKDSEPFTLQLLGRRFMGGEQSSAIDDLEKYLAKVPSSQGEWLLASCYRNLGESDKIRPALKRALEIDAHFVPARVDLAVSLAQAGDPVSADRQFRKALEDAPYYPKGYYNYGAFLMQEERFAEAAGYFERAVAISPGYLKARFATVAAYVAAGEHAKADSALAQLQQVFPGSPEAEQAAALLRSDARVGNS